jgi:hypothetical protein
LCISGVPMTVTRPAAGAYLYIVPEFNGFDAELPPTHGIKGYRTVHTLSFSILYYWFYDSSLPGPDFKKERKKEI